MVSCSDVTPVSGNSDRRVVVFDNVQTKTLITSTDQIANFSVMAQMNLGADGEDKATEYIMLLDNEEVTRAGAGYPWTYENTRYWAPDRLYHFFAVYPSSQDDASPVQISSTADADFGAYAYNVTFDTPETADQELLTSYVSVETIGENFPESVGFNFDHQLTNVHLKLWRDGRKDGEGDVEQVRLKQVVLSNVSKTGTLTTTRTGNSWNLSSTRISFTKDYNDDGEQLSGAKVVDGQLVLTDGTNNPGVPFGTDGLLLIPHTLSTSNPVLVTVEYERLVEADDEDYWETKILQTFLPDGTWPAGKRVTYNMILSGEKTISKVEIVTQVDDWYRQTEEIDFSETVLPEEKIQWIEGTYEALDEEKGEVLLYTDKAMVATCRFKLQTPVGATWTASLIPLTEAAMDAFSIVENTKYGDVGTGEWQYIMLKVNNQAPIARRHECLLRITVQTAGGRTIVVKNLMPEVTEDGIEEYKIIQNLING